MSLAVKPVERHPPDAMGVEAIPAFVFQGAVAVSKEDMIAGEVDCGVAEMAVRIVLDHSRDRPGSAAVAGDGSHEGGSALCAERKSSRMVVINREEIG